MTRHVITLFKTQTSRASSYVRHDCSEYVFYCLDTIPCGYTGSVQDMKIDDYACTWGCPTQNVCLKPDRAEGDIGKNSEGRDPLLSVFWDVTPPNIKCTYDLNKIDTPAQIHALKRLFPVDQVNHIMREFCTKKRENCSDGRTECSALTAMDEAGEVCRAWLAELPSDEIRDSVRREYCMHNDTEDCKCINRTKHTDFTELRRGMDAQTMSSTRCWYKPCENNSNLLLDVEQKRECSVNVCENIIDAHARGDININNNTSSLNCSFTRKQLEAANEQREALLNPVPLNQPDTWATTLAKYKLQFGIGGLVLALLVLLALLTRRRVGKR